MSILSKSVGGYGTPQVKKREELQTWGEERLVPDTNTNDLPFRNRQRKFHCNVQSTCFWKLELQQI